MKLRPEEIASVLRSQIENYQAEVEVEEVGTVLEVGDGIARIYGLRNALAMEMLDLPHGVTGLALNLVLRSQIENYQAEVEVEEVGTVLEVGDGIARIYGLRNALAMEMLDLPHGVTGLALNLEEDNVGAVLLGQDTLIKEGDLVKRSGKVLQVPVGKALVGRVVDPLGNPLDDKGPDRDQRASARWSSRRPAWSSARGSRSRCRPASRRSTR